jgi:hypothetical protein
MSIMREGPHLTPDKAAMYRYTRAVRRQWGRGIDDEIIIVEGNASAIQIGPQSDCDVVVVQSAGGRAFLVSRQRPWVGTLNGPIQIKPFYRALSFGAVGPTQIIGSVSGELDPTYGNLTQLDGAFDPGLYEVDVVIWHAEIPPQLFQDRAPKRFECTLDNSGQSPRFGLLVPSMGRRFIRWNLNWDESDAAPSTVAVDIATYDLFQLAGAVNGGVNLPLMTQLGTTAGRNKWASIFPGLSAGESRSYEGCLAMNNSVENPFAAIGAGYQDSTSRYLRPDYVEVLVNTYPNAAIPYSTAPNLAITVYD